MDESMVENEQLESVQDDTAQASTAQEEQDGIVALSDLLGNAAEGKLTEETPEEPQEAAQNEQTRQEQEQPVNKGIKGRLMAENKKGYDAGYSAAQKEWEAKEADYKSRLERLDQIELQEKADRIAKEQGVSNDIAMFLAKNGFEPTNTEARTPARDANTGRFVSQQKQNTQTSDYSERANVLYEQSKNIQRMNGVNALDLFRSADADTQGKIARGEMDLYDLVRETSSTKSAKRTPPNIRTNTSRGTGIGDPSKWTDADIDRVNDYLKRGGVVNG